MALKGLKQKPAVKLQAATNRQAVLALEGLELQHCQRQLQCHS